MFDNDVPYVYILNYYSTDATFGLTKIRFKYVYVNCKNDTFGNVFLI